MYVRCIFQYMLTLLFQVPVEEREYLKDQRAKIGPKGTFQLGLIDKAGVKNVKGKQKD